MKILLDTNAYSALRRNHKTVAEFVQDSQEVLLSAVVAGELLYGFRNGSRYEANVRVLAEFLEDPNVRVLPVTWDTADLFGRISADLRKKDDQSRQMTSGSPRMRRSQARISSPPTHTSATLTDFPGGRSRDRSRSRSSAR